MRRPPRLHDDFGGFWCSDVVSGAAGASSMVRTRANRPVGDAVGVLSTGRMCRILLIPPASVGVPAVAPEADLSPSRGAWPLAAPRSWDLDTHAPISPDSPGGPPLGAPPCNGPETGRFSRQVPAVPLQHLVSNQVWLDFSPTGFVFFFCNRPFISITQEFGSNFHVQRCYANSRTWGARSIEPVGKTFLPLGDCSIAHARTVVTRVRRVGGRPRVSKVTENGTLNVPGSHAPASRYDVACRIVPRVCRASREQSSAPPVGVIKS
jgi:hypothetical protein